MTRLISYLRHGVFEANPLQAGLQVDFEELEADPSKMTISQNIHPASEIYRGRVDFCLSNAKIRL